MASPAVSTAGTNVIIQWTMPSSNGDPITAYNILILGSDDQFHSQTTYCNGAQASIIASLECFIPMSTFWAAPFSLS